MMSLVRAQQGEPEERPFSNGLFSIQSEGLVWNLTAGEYGIAVGVWHTPCSLAVSTAARCALFRQRRNARGAICARSLTSELADLLRLIITRQRVFFLRIDAIHHFVMIPSRPSV